MNYDPIGNDSGSDNEYDFELAPLAGPERVQLSKGGQQEQPTHSRHGSIMDAVTAIVPESDDPTLPTLTFRVVVVGSVFVSLGCVLR